MVNNVAALRQEASHTASVVPVLPGWSVGQMKAHINGLVQAQDYQALRDLHMLHLSDAKQGHMAVLLGTSRSFNLFIVTTYATFAPEISRAAIEFGRHLYLRDGIVGDVQVEAMLLETGWALAFFQDIDHLEMFPAEFQALLLEHGCPVLANLRAFEGSALVDLQHGYETAPVRCIKNLQLMAPADRRLALNTIQDHSLAALVVQLNLVTRDDLDGIDNEIVRCAVLESELL